MKTGLCSITFRKLSVFDIAALARDAGLEAVEWGGDLHVPHGDLSAAEEALRVSRDAGLTICSYGSYYKVVDCNGNLLDFMPVLESALALGTNTIRVWAGVLPSEVAGKKYRTRFVEKLRADLDIAADHNVRLALEFHVNSLADSNRAALDLLNEVNHPNLYTYWQPIYWLADSEYRLQGLRELAPHVINLHVFQWLFHPMRGGWTENIERRSLEDGAKEWRNYLSVDLPSGDHCALLEFVPDDLPENFKRDAEFLKSWVNRI